ncbi:MAG: aminotransferase class V-fold PLP-dependent enzyme [Gammaproteobacteria bacterium]|nr:MAG: aminotransferase class V-fold PLP-dependent enzyme [Gammaproteobacteria bacterium]UCH41471.1 MAG: aminotransferase class V-fold PLP-dependent enzyme [Gammaproteobacteria bacterium]
MKLDIDFVRAQFGQLEDDPEFVFASNAGGSYVCNQVNDVLEHYNRHTRVQPYSRYASSAAAGEAMDRALSGWADALNIGADELSVGPSTSMNTYVMAQAIGDLWMPGDEIIVTNQDHEANSGAWRRKAHEKGVTIRQWEVEPDSGLLNIETLLPLLRDNTRWVFFTHCSNIVGTVNPVAEIVKTIKSGSKARVFIDAVAYAPHHISDMKALGVDAYAFSLYKVFGPHQGLMYVNRDIRGDLTSQAHYFNSGIPTKDFNPAGPQHAQVAGCAGVLDYFDALHRHHFGDSDKSANVRLDNIHRLILQHENELAAPILDFLHNHADVRLLGKSHARDNDRAPTIAFKPLRQSSEELTHKLQDAGIGTEHGNFYAHRLISDLGIDPDDGVVRLSLVHYGSDNEVERILQALDMSLA